MATLQYKGTRKDGDTNEYGTEGIRGVDIVGDKGLGVTLKVESLNQKLNEYPGDKILTVTIPQGCKDVDEQFHFRFRPH